MIHWTVKKTEYLGAQLARISMTCYMTSFMETLCDQEYKVVHRKTQQVMTLDVEDESSKKYIRTPRSLRSLWCIISPLESGAQIRLYSANEPLFLCWTIQKRYREVCDPCVDRMVLSGTKYGNLVQKEITAAVCLGWIFGLPALFRTRGLATFACAVLQCKKDEATESVDRTFKPIWYKDEGIVNAQMCCDLQIL